MRVISGKLKGRMLKGFDIEGTRPTMDRVKESVFASIQDKIEDSIVLDLFAGSGNLGIEAISNGASICYFVDFNLKCIQAIQENIKMFQIEEECIVLKNDYLHALKEFRDKNLQFDIIFIDPPYKYCIKNELLKNILDYHLLAEDGIIVFEYQNDEKIDDNIFLELIRDKKYGDKYVSVYKKIKNQKNKLHKNN